jgi:Na+/H+ antiporter NhaC
MKHLSFKRKVLAFVLVLAVVLAAATAFAAQEGEDFNPFTNTFWSLVPPIVAIALALITREVYSSLFAGVIVGGFFVANLNPERAMHVVLDDGLVAVLADGWNVGILIFTVLLGVISALSFKAGGTVAYGEWAQKRIKHRVGAQFATVALGCLIFVDDYFNCLTVGNVMRPVTDSHQISRAKLAYIVDATAAPVCIIAPISSWAAAVTGFRAVHCNGEEARWEAREWARLVSNPRPLASPRHLVT